MSHQFESDPPPGPAVDNVLDDLPDGVVVVDDGGRVRHLNEVARRLLEVDGRPGDHISDVMTLQDLDGNSWLDCVAPFHGLPARRLLLESSWRSPSGREVLVTAAICRDPATRAVRQVAIALRDARSRERVDRGRSDLVATVAHELRSPLTGVKGFTATLLSKWDLLTDSQKLLMLNTVDADADRLTRLISELLDVARIDSGRLSLMKAPLDLTLAVSRQLAPLSASNGRGISVESVGSPTVWADADKVAQIVANLVENAVRHGGGNVVVTVLAREDGGADLIVDDEGEGIPEEIRARIFTKFWKHGQRGGSGLGLYIVGGLVAAHGGTVSVESAPTGGARMRVTLPEGKPNAVD